MSEDRLPEHQHDFDGIEELDNDLPRWWLGIFAVTLIVAVAYVPWFHFMHPEKLPHQALAAEMDAREQVLAKVEAEKPKGADLESELLKRYKQGGWEASAKTDFGTYCMPCHAPDGGGTIGPNFTDDFYIHGGTLSDIQRVITEGVPEKGMVPWKAALKPEQIENLTFFIRSLRGTVPATAKEPQGKKVDEDGNFLPEE